MKSGEIVDLFYANCLYKVLRIRCERENCQHHIACSAMAKLMLRSGEARINHAGTSIHVEKGAHVLLHENLVYYLHMKKPCDFLVAYPTNSSLLYPVEIT